MKICGLIPARGGSKGVPRKNIKMLGDKPLIAYTIDDARKSKYLSNVIVSTDDIEIANIAKFYGAEIPFMRPKKLAQSETQMVDVIKHVINFYESIGEKFDLYCILQPTTPYRVENDIDGTIEKLIKTNADTAMTIYKIPHAYNPYWVYFKDVNDQLELSIKTDKVLRRQELPYAYARAGTAYVIKNDTIKKYNSIYGKKIVGYEINNILDVNIDEMDDWNKAEKLLGTYLKLREKGE